MPIEVGISTDREDKKIMEKEKKAGFSGVGTKKYDYDRQYHKDHYKRVHLVVKPELLEQIKSMVSVKSKKQVLSIAMFSSLIILAKSELLSPYFRQ